MFYYILLLILSEITVYTVKRTHFNRFSGSRARCRDPAVTRGPQSPGHSLGAPWGAVEGGVAPAPAPAPSQAAETPAGPHTQHTQTKLSYYYIFILLLFIYIFVYIYIYKFIFF